MFVPVGGPIVADTVYSDGQLIGRDVALTLPAVTPQSADLPIMGTFSMPVWSLIQHMEAQITKVGLDKGLRSAIKPDMKPVEFRWVQTVMDVNGGTKEVGCKAFLRGVPAELPEVGVTIGSATEHPIKIALTRYNLFVDGEEMWLIDRMAGIVRIDGKDYANFDSML